MADAKAQNNDKAPAPVNPRDAIREARQRRLKLVDGDRAANTVKVYAANETYRELLRHSNGTGFRSALDQEVEWPNDSFTARRIAEGSVRTDGPGSGDLQPPDETLNARQQADALKPKEKDKEPKAAEAKYTPKPQQHQTAP